MIVDHEGHLPGILSGTHYDGILAGNHLSRIRTGNYLHICISIVHMHSVHCPKRRAQPPRHGSSRCSQVVAGILHNVHEIVLVLELLQ